MTSLIQIAKSIARPLRNFVRDKIIQYKLKKQFRHRSQAGVTGFDFKNLKIDVLKFLKKMKCDDAPFAYYYSKSSTKPTLYSSVYACMTLGLLGELDKLSPEEGSEWGKYFDSFQNEDDGLFYDSVVQNEIYNDSDWWGARHLALHIVCAYSDLGLKPKYQFKFLDEYCEPGAIVKWLSKFDWRSGSIGDDDIDNKIMNIGCLLQYQRDYWSDRRAAAALIELKEFLRTKINKNTGIWGGDDLREPSRRSRMVQFAYHLFPIFFYDDEYDFELVKITSTVLATQNNYGGYGVMPNSSACEDIDSLDLLLIFLPKVSMDAQAAILTSIKNGLNWVLINQVDDGGFVFRLFSKFYYGHEQMQSGSNQGSMFPTWFRLLSLSNLCRLRGKWPIARKKVPGYYFN